MKNYPLVDPNKFHDACGIGFIATRSGKKEKRILPIALSSLKKLSHRGAKSYDKKSGDGSGILIDLPKEYFKAYLMNDCKINVPKNKKLAVAMVFSRSKKNKRFDTDFLKVAKQEKLNFLSKREVPVDASCLGQVSRSVMPYIYQYIFSFPRSTINSIEKKLYFLRKVLEKKYSKQKTNPYICSFSSQTIIIF